MLWLPRESQGSSKLDATTNDYRTHDTFETVDSTAALDGVCRADTQMLIAVSIPSVTARSRRLFEAGRVTPTFGVISRQQQQQQVHRGDHARTLSSLNAALRHAMRWLMIPELESGQKYYLIR
jgi:hypothetical protein